MVGTYSDSNMSRITQVVAAVLLAQVACTCGASVNTFITGGRDALPGQFPYQVSIQYGVPPFIKYIPWCSGSILNERWVLTSAKCLSWIPRLGKVVVKAGMHGLDKDSEWVQKSEVLLQLVHKEYYRIMKLITPYDIGLVKLKTPLRFNKRVQPITLSKKYEQPEGEATITGWGSVFKNVIPMLPKVLQVAEVSIISEENCRDALKSIVPSEYLVGTQFCTSPLDKTISACTGHSGDPLVQLNKSDNTSVLIGIMSWTSLQCGSNGSPTIYTMVSSFVYWIEEQIAENS